MTSIISLGFTGTGVGMTDRQKWWFSTYVVSLGPDEFHHGDCIGADEEAHWIVKKMVPLCRIIIHPPTNPRRRAACSGAYSVLPEKPYIIRDHDIVDSSTHMIGTPRGFREELRSGTWATIRYALKRSKKPTIIWPDGSTSESMWIS